MIDTDNLRTASLYINNQLLSRGLLRDGQNIDFANLGLGGIEGSETAGRIISVLNDLILRRDRDAEQRESLSTAMRNLRAENLKHTSDATRLSEKCTEAQRKLDIATASEATLKTQLKSAESATRGLKDELARTKALVAQARASCATEIRRRDRQIDTLKKQVGEAGRARGAKANSAIMSITVTGDVGGEEKKSPTRNGNTTTEDYSLRSETNSFLANLAQNLSEENEALLRVMHRTKDQLREMSGWGGNEKEDAQVVKQPAWEEMASELDSVMEHMRTILTNPSFVPIEEVMIREEEINRLKAGWLKMESRWEDAVHLMDSWRKRMAASGEPVADEELQMGLRLSPVRVNNVEETRKARERGLPAVKEESEEEVDLVQSPCPAPRQSVPVEQYQEEEVYEESEGEYSGYEDEIPVEENGVEEPNVEVEELSAAMASHHIMPSVESSPLPEPPQLSPLRNSASAGNRRLQVNKVRQKPGDFTTIAEEKTQDSTGDAGLAKPTLHRIKPVAQQLRPITTANKPEERERSVSRTSLDDVLLPNGRRSASENVKSGRPEPTGSQDGPTANESDRSGGFRQIPRRMPPRLARPRHSDPDPQQNPPNMSTIAAKLAASEKEADAARVRAKIKAVRSASGGVQRPVITHVPEPVADVKPEPADEEDVDPVKRDPVSQEAQQKPDKRKRERRAAKTSSRRRSTLSPFELETLISGNAR